MTLRTVASHECAARQPIRHRLKIARILGGHEALRHAAGTRVPQTIIDA
jgi:hypothetical protein